MAELKFKNLNFIKEKNKVKVILLKHFYFFIDNDELKKIGDFKIKTDSIIFRDASNQTAERKFNFLISKNIGNLKSAITGKKTVYIHQNSGIPLTGTNYFGIVDRGSSLIEIKPITGCNLNCIYCSIDQSRRYIDFVVEKDYLVSELKSVIEYKGIDGIEIHIGPNGEPLLYADLIELIKDISKIKQIKTISIDTNGTLLNERIIKKLEKAGLSRINLSINSLNPELAKKIAGCSYHIENIMQIGEYITKKSKIDLIIAPVMIPGVNEQEMPKLVEFALKIGSGKRVPPIGIQNFLNYKFGRNPVKQMQFDEFKKKIRKIEAKYKIRLLLDETDFKIQKTKSLPKPFKKGDIIEANIISEASLKNEKLAVSGGRVISVPNCSKKGEVRLKIIRSKHNIFVGRLI